MEIERIKIIGFILDLPADHHSLSSTKPPYLGLTSCSGQQANQKKLPQLRFFSIFRQYGFSFVMENVEIYAPAILSLIFWLQSVSLF
jgi:hypothetical protein